MRFENDDDTMKEAIDQLMGVLKYFDSRGEEFFALNASLMGRARDALMKEGFTEDQAVSILAHQGGFIKQG